MTLFSVNHFTIFGAKEKSSFFTILSLRTSLKATKEKERRLKNTDIVLERTRKIVATRRNKEVFHSKNCNEKLFFEKSGDLVLL